MQNAVLVVAGGMIGSIIMEVFRLRTPLFTLQQLCNTADARLFWCFVNFILNQKRGALRMIDARHGPARNQINH